MKAVLAYDMWAALFCMSIELLYGLATLKWHPDGPDVMVRLFASMLCVHGSDLEGKRATPMLQCCDFLYAVHHLLSKCVRLPNGAAVSIICKLCQSLCFSIIKAAFSVYFRMMRDLTYGRHDAGGCSIEVIDVPSLAIFEVTGQSSQQIEQATLHVQYSEHHSDALQREQQTHANLTHQHQTHVQNDRQHLCASQQEDVSSPLNDADTDSRETHRHGKERISEASPVDTPQPSISCEESKHTQSALPESRHATNTRHAERQGTGQSLTAMEQLLASLPDIDIIASPAQLQRSHDNMAQHPPPTRQGDSVQEHLPDQAQQIHASREVCRSDQEQPHSALHEDATGQGENSGNQANHSNTSEITSEPASFLYAQPTQKQLRKQKRKGVLVPQVDSAVQACRISISPGIAAVQPSPGSLGLDAIVSATEGLLQAPHTASTSRPALTARAKAQSAQPAYSSRPHPTQKAVAPTHKPSKPPTHFIADLQLDLAARVLAKQPDLAQMEQLSSMQQRGLSYSNMLLSGQQHRSFSPTGAPRLARHAAEQQAFSPGISLQTAAGAALKAGSASHLFTYVSPTEQPCTADPHASWRSRVADSAAGAPLTASLPAFDVGSIQSHVAAGGQSPIMARAGQPPLDLHALICAMVASEHTAAALEQQLAASSQRAACIPGKATGSMLSLLTGRQDVPMQTVPGIPMSLQDSWPEGDPIAQNQLVAKYIDAGTIIQGYPISIPTLDEQQTAQWAAPGTRLPSHGFRVTEGALAPVLQTLRQKVLCCAVKASGRPAFARRAT